MVSARKEARSAHVEISKMEVQDEGGQERTAPKPRRPARALLQRHEVKVCLDLFLYACKHVPRLSDFVFSKSSPSSSVFYEWVRLSSVLVLYGTYRAHNERMTSVVSAERGYCCWTDGM